MMPDKEEITVEKLGEFEKRTNDKFTNFLINDIKKRLLSSREIGMYEILDFKRISSLVQKEENRNRLKGRKIKWDHIKDLELRIIPRCGKSKKLKVEADTTLKELSSTIRQDFDLERGHLYEFEIGKLKFGPKCDEWQETFDGLDTFQIGYLVAFSGLKEGDFFKFLYDFGDNIQFKIEICQINNE